MALLGSPWLPSALYPVTQVGVITAVLVPWRQAAWYVAGLVLAAVMTVLWEGVGHTTLLLDTVAAGVVCWLVWPRRDLGRLRSLLLIAFGVGWLAWVGYVFAPGWTTWGLYQGMRAVSCGLFCWASCDHRTMRWVEGY